ncbi:mannosyltransferase [Acidimicrobiia bacterium]
MPEWVQQCLNPWTTPATILIVVVGVGYLLGLRNRRLTVCAAIVATGLALWQAWSIGPPSGLLDLQIYVGAARGWTEARSLYAFTDPVFNLSATYPPIGPILFSVFVPLGADAREVLFTAVSLGALFAASWSATQLAGLDRTRRLIWAPAAYAAAIVTMPVWLTLRQGQVNIILWALIICDVAAISRRSRFGGIAIGIATAIKLTPGLFILWLVSARRIRPALLALVGAGGATALGWAIAPADSKKYWTDLVWHSDRVGSLIDSRNNAVFGVVARLVPQGSARTGLWLVALVVVLGVALARGSRAARQDDLLAAVAIIGCAAVLVSPISWTHHLGFLVLALMACIQVVRKPWQWAALAIGWLLLVEPGGHGDGTVYLCVRMTLLLGTVMFLPVIPGRSNSNAPVDDKPELVEV